MNKVILRGNLGADPELRATSSGRAVSNFRVATNERYTDNEGNRHERTEWHRIVCWGKLGKNCAEYLTKGRSVLIEGKLQTRQWEDRDGKKRFTTEVVASNVEFLKDGSTRGNTDTGEAEASIDDDDGPELESDADKVFNG